MRTTLLLALGVLALSGCAGYDGERSTRSISRDYRASTPKASLHSNAVEFPIHGVDVSKYQGDIDWPRVAASGTKFAWIKATEGGDRFDEKFDANWRGAKAAGVPRGAYHFVYWCRPMWQQAEWFRKHVPNDPDALPPVLDVEWTGDSRTCPKKLSAETAQGEMQVMLTEMERFYGKRPVIYATVDFYEDVLSGGAFSDYPIWVRSTKWEPKVKYGSRKWHFWQYQSDGYVPGIAAKVDRNAFHGSSRDWQAFLNADKGSTQVARAEPKSPAVPEAKPEAQPELAAQPPSPLATATGAGLSAYAAAPAGTPVPPVRPTTLDASDAEPAAD